VVVAAARLSNQRVRSSPTPLTASIEGKLLGIQTAYHTIKVIFVAIGRCKYSRGKFLPKFEQLPTTTDLTSQKREDSSISVLRAGPLRRHPNVQYRSVQTCSHVHSALPSVAPCPCAHAAHAPPPIQSIRSAAPSACRSRLVPRRAGGAVSRASLLFTYGNRKHVVAGVNRSERTQASAPIVHHWMLALYPCGQSLWRVYVLTHGVGDYGHVQPFPIGEGVREVASRGYTASLSGRGGSVFRRGSRKEVGTTPP